MQGYPKTIATRADVENLLSDNTYQAQAIAYLQTLMDEEYGYDADGAWGLVGGGGLERLGLTRAEAVALGAVDRVVAEPTFDLGAYKEQVYAAIEAERDTRLYATFTDSNGITYYVDAKGRGYFQDAKATLVDGGSLPGGFSITTTTGQQEHTDATFRALWNEFQQWVVNMFACAVLAKSSVALIEKADGQSWWDVRAEVDAAVAAVVWPTS